MIMTVKVTLDEVIHLDCFKSLLEKYRDFTSCYREIKINSITGKKSQFEISQMNPPIICGFENQETSNYNIFRLKESCFTINSIDLIVNNKLEILDINLKIKIMDTDNGKILETIIDQVEFRVFRISRSDELKEVSGFYACNNIKLSA
jgi:hypothetical protein